MQAQEETLNKMMQQLPRAMQAHIFKNLVSIDACPEKYDAYWLKYFDFLSQDKEYDMQDREFVRKWARRMCVETCQSFHSNKRHAFVEKFHCLKNLRRKTSCLIRNTYFATFVPFFEAWNAKATVIATPREMPFNSIDCPNGRECEGMHYKCLQCVTKQEFWLDEQTSFFVDLDKVNIRLMLGLVVLRQYVVMRHKLNDFYNYTSFQAISTYDKDTHYWSELRQILIKESLLDPLDDCGNVFRKVRTSRQNMGLPPIKSIQSKNCVIV